jgi:hypothetical protein
VPEQVVVVEGVKGGKYTSLPAEKHKNSAENRRFPALSGLKIAKNSVFRSKVLNNHKSFFKVDLCI